MCELVEYGEYTISSTPSKLLGKREWMPAVVGFSEREKIVTAVVS